MANQVLLNPGRALDLNGYVVPGAKATFYLAGTSTLTTIYEDIAETIPAANPAIADGNGVFPQRYATVSVKVVITSASDETLYTLDPAPIVQSTGAGASQISFAPTVPLPFTNVQAAIEGAAAASAAGFAAFGIGITGNAALLANLDAINIGAGVYRFDGTTTGTYPSGVAAADTGLIETWRQASGVAMMELGHGTSDRVFRRRLAAGVWGTWREEILVNQGAVAGDIIRRGASAWERLAIGANGTVLTVVAGAPAYAVPVAAPFVSAEQTITTSGALTLAHGLSATPTLFNFSLICKTAEGGHSINDVVQIAVPAQVSATTTRGASIVADATNINVRYCNSTDVFEIIHKSTGASFQCTNGNWRFLVRAWVL